MTPAGCRFETDLLAAIDQDRWPARVDAALRAHVESCSACSDLAAVAAAFDGARAETAAAAAVPDASRIWWRAQMRARREAVQAAGRPITAAQVLAFAGAMGLLGACFGATSTWFQSTLRWLASKAAGFDAASLIAGHELFVIGLAAVVFLVPTAVLVVLGRD